MSYGIAACDAVKMITEQGMSPAHAWNTAIEMHPLSHSSKTKGCPRDAFLSLCSHGFVHGVNEGHYSLSEHNWQYAKEAVNILRELPEKKFEKLELWKLVLQKLGIDKKHHNSQMTVVLALWNEGLIS